MKQHEASVLLFVRHAHVPFTNNRAEQDLRMAKVKQKVSSYLQTIANQGYNPLTAIQLALAGKTGNVGGE